MGLRSSILRFSGGVWILIGIVNHGFEPRKIESNFHHWLVAIRILDLQNGFCFGILLFSHGRFFPDIQLSSIKQSQLSKHLLSQTRWWFQIIFLFTPKIGEDEPILTSILFRWVGSTTNQLAKSSPLFFCQPLNSFNPLVAWAGPGSLSLARPQVGWTVKDLDLIEANEAFAAQALAVNKVRVVRSDDDDDSVATVKIFFPPKILTRKGFQIYVL